MINASEIERWIEALFPAGRSYAGHLRVNWPEGTGEKAIFPGHSFTRNNVAGIIECAKERDQLGTTSIYLRMTTVTANLSPYLRGGANDSIEISCLWADLDILGEGHKRTDLPPDEESAWKILALSGLPAPTMVVHSGYGLYALWLLVEPATIGEDLKAWKKLSADWQNALIRSGARLGFHVDNVGSLDHVLRLPGTLNRKIADAEVHPMCRILSTDGPRYTMPALQEAIAALPSQDIQQTLPPAPAPASTAFAAPAGREKRPGEVSPFDDFEDRTPWSDILPPNGWSQLSGTEPAECHWHWEGASNGLSATTGRAQDRNRMWVFSESCGLPMGQTAGPLSKPFVYAAYWHAGDLSAAARHLRTLGYGTPPATQATEATHCADLRERPENASHALATHNHALAQDPPEDLSSVRVTRPFPSWALPGWVRSMVEGLAGELQLGIEAVALIALGALSAAAAGRLMVRVRGQWLEPVCLWVLLIADPGARKSPILQRLLKPLLDAERALVQAAMPRIVEQETEREILKRRAEAALKSAGGDKAGIDAEANAKGAAAALAECEVEVPPQLIAQDITVEAIAGLIADQGGRLTIMSDEAIILPILAGRYSKQTCTETVCSAWSGQRIRVDRKTRESDFCETPSLTMILATQPDRLIEITSDSRMAGSGFLARWLPVWPANTVGYRLTGPDVPTVSDAVEVTYAARLASIAQRMWQRDAADILSLDSGATGILTAFEAELERRMRPGTGDIGILGKSVVEWTAKAVGQAARIAGLLHLAKHPDDHEHHRIDADTARAAVALTEYYAEHAAACLVGETDPMKHVAKSLLEWIAGKASIGTWAENYGSRRDIFSLADLTRSMSKVMRQRYPSRANSDPDIVTLPRVLEALTEYGHLEALVEPERPSAKGVRPSPRYRLVPSGGA